MLTLLFTLIALVSPMEDDYPVMDMIDADTDFLVSHIDYSELKDEKKWGAIRKYLLQMNGGQFFRDYLPKKIRNNMLSDTTYSSMLNGEEGKLLKQLKIRQFKLDQAQAVTELLPGITTKKNSLGQTIFKIDTQGWKDGKEIWTTHLGDGIHIYANTEAELNQTLKDMEEAKGTPHPALKEMLKLVEGKPGLWMIMDGANTLNESFKGTVTLMAYLMNPEEESLSLITATSFVDEKQKQKILELKKEEPMPGSRTEVEGDLVVSRGVIGSEFWNSYGKAVKKNKKELEDYNKHAVERMEEHIRINKKFINSSGADPEQVKLAKESLKYMEESLKKWKERQKEKKK